MIKMESTSWIRFDIADRQTKAPSFCLPSIQGDSVALEDFHDRCNLVIFFAHYKDCPNCSAMLRELAIRNKDFDKEDTKVLVIVSEAGALPATDKELLYLPFPVLVDAQGLTRHRFSSLMDRDLISSQKAMFFVLDRYGAPYLAIGWHEGPSSELIKEVFEWVEYIAVQCPE